MAEVLRKLKRRKRRVKRRTEGRRTKKDAVVAASPQQLWEDFEEPPELKTPA